MKYYFIDFEMCPVERKIMAQKPGEKCSMEIIEIGVIRLNEDLKEDASFKAYVKPQFSTRITKRYENLTGITQEMLDGADDFQTVMANFLEWVSDSEKDYVIYAWSENDLKQLMQEMRVKDIALCSDMEYMTQHWQDFQREYCDLFKIDRVLSLNKAVRLAGLDFDGRKHDALWDARNTAQLFARTRDGEEFEVLRKKISEVLSPKPLTMPLGDVLKEKLAAAGFDFADNEND